MQEDEDISEEKPEAVNPGSQKEEPSDAGDVSEAEDVVYVDEDMLANMDLQEDAYGDETDPDDDFRTMKESEMGDDDQLLYQDG